MHNRLRRRSNVSEWTRSDGVCDAENNVTGAAIAEEEAASIVPRDTVGLVVSNCIRVRLARNHVAAEEVSGVGHQVFRSGAAA
eukprot:scaffold3728_cov417-Prasinococcus_capsulatus_cf.AAC.1